MPIIIGIKFKNGGKLYYFSPKNIDFEVEDGVIVETTRGVEYATVVQKNTEVSEDEIKNPLKEVVRKATEKDLKQYKDNEERAKKAFIVCQEKVAKHNLPMKLINAEYTFDRQKVIFNFTADGRVDFRELVKDLASELKMRIELHQVYEKDDVVLRGAMGMCGRECCCISCPQICDKATVKMAKNQNISINPTKVSGMCGKLMCCLRYENEFYQNIIKKMPKVNSIVETKDGLGRVVSVNLLREYIVANVEIDDSFVEKRFNLDEFKLNNSNEKEEVSAEDDKDSVE